MLYMLVSFSEQIGPLNVFRYITFRTGGAIMTALLFVFLFGPVIIDLLRLKQGKGQPIREDGPQTHLAKKRHADHGRAHDPGRHDGLDAAVGQPEQLVCLDRAVRDAQLSAPSASTTTTSRSQGGKCAGFSGRCACWPRSWSPVAAAS